jgi:hypothetical protein
MCICNGDLWKSVYKTETAHCINSVTKVIQICRCGSVYVYKVHWSKNELEQ